MANHGFKAHPDCGGIGRSTRGPSCLLQEILVNMKSLLHTYDFAILVWQLFPGLGAFGAAEQEIDAAFGVRMCVGGEVKIRHTTKV